MPLWAPPWAGWFLFIISLNPCRLCNEVGSVKLRLGRVSGLRRGGGGSWTLRVYLQGPQCWDSHSRPFQTAFSSCCLSAPASALCPWPWQPAQVPVEVSPRQQGVAGRMGLGWEGGVRSGFVCQPGVGAGAPAAMRYPPRECGPATPPLESPQLPGAPSKPVALLPLATHPPSEKPGTWATWEPGSLWWPHPALLGKHKLSGSLKQLCQPAKLPASQLTS